MPQTSTPVVIPAASFTGMAGPLSSGLRAWVSDRFGAAGGAIADYGRTFHMAYNDASGSGGSVESLQSAFETPTDTIEEARRLFSTISRFEPSRPDHWLNPYAAAAYNALTAWQADPTSRAAFVNFATKYDTLVRAMLASTTSSSTMATTPFFKRPTVLAAIVISSAGILYLLYEQKKHGGFWGLGRARTRRRRRRK